MGGPLCTHRVAPDSALPIDISPFLRSVAAAESGSPEGKGAEDPSLRLLFAQVLLLPLLGIRKRGRASPSSSPHFDLT